MRGRSRCAAHAREGLSERRITYYQKMQDAVDAGYLLVPNMPDNILALRAKRETPRQVNPAQRLMLVANTPFFVNAAHARYLPPSWMTLYELSQLPTATLRRALEAGEITPDMPRHAVVDLANAGSTTRPDGCFFRWLATGVIL